MTSRQNERKGVEKGNNSTRIKKTHMTREKSVIMTILLFFLSERQCCSSRLQFAKSMHKTTISESTVFLSKKPLKAREVLGQAGLSPGCWSNQCSEIDKMITLTLDYALERTVLLGKEAMLLISQDQKGINIEYSNRYLDLQTFIACYNFINLLPWVYSQYVW